MNTISRFRGHSLTARLEQLHTIDRRVREVQQALGQVQMIEAFGAIALEHAFSAPVVDTMRATPGFVQAVKNFPESNLFNIVPEHKSSPRQVMGLESLGEAQGENVNQIRSSAAGLAVALGIALEGLDSVATELQQQLAAQRAVIEATELPEEIVASLPVVSLSQDAFSQMFLALESQLPALEAFNTDDLRANPEQIKGEIESLTALVTDLGATLGLELNEQGLTEADRGEDFIPTEGSIEQKGFDKASLVFFIDRADSLCEELRGLSTRREEMVASINQAVEEIPEALNSDEVTYGANEHLTLMTCYATLVGKLLRETTVTISQVLTTADAVVEAHVDSTETI